MAAALVPSVSYADTAQKRVRVEKVDENHLEYSVYELKGVERVDLSDLIISDSAKGRPDGLNFLWDEVPDFKQELLNLGLARLREPAKASAQYLESERRAKELQLGIWAPKAPPPTPQIETERGFDFVALFWKILTYSWYLISALGIVSVISAIYYFLYIRRRVQLLIIGKPSAGKSAIFARIKNPKLDRKLILDLKPTPVRQGARLREHIQYAKFEIYPRLTDVPGSAYSTVWDEVTKWRFRFGFMRRHALLLVLAPTEKNSKTTMSEGDDQRFRDTQLGYVQALVEGSFGARKTAKPKIVIVFLNKFDLACDYPPGDSNASDQEKGFTLLFAEHLKSVRLAAEKAGIHFHAFAGSALNDWNCSNLITVIGKTLYGD
jgi:hypothetical protein